MRAFKSLAYHKDHQTRSDKTQSDKETHPLHNMHALLDNNVRYRRHVYTDVTYISQPQLSLQFEKPVNSFSSTGRPFDLRLNKK